MSMGKVRRGGYIFITWKGDHDPYHVHIFKDSKEVAKFNLEDNVVMSGKINNKILKLIKTLQEEGEL
jgi:hypothetical protein